MRRVHARLREALGTGDAEAAIAADDDFHEVALNRSGNPLIPEHLEVVTATLRRAEFLHFESVKGSASPEQHTEIIAAIRAGEHAHAVALTKANWSTL